MKYETHALADRFPMMTDERLVHLAQLIEAHGLRDPITLYEGKILDGRNRARACELAGVAPRFVPFDGDDPAAFVLDKNIGRRDLTDDQRAAIVVDFEPIIAAEVEQGRRRKISQARGETVVTSPQSQQPSGSAATRRTLAERASVSTQKIRQATALKRADSPLLKEVQDGTMKLSAALNEEQQRKRRSLLNPAVFVSGQVERQPQRRRVTSDIRDDVIALVRAYPCEPRALALVEKIKGERLDLPHATLRNLIEHLEETGRLRLRLLALLRAQASTLVRKEA